MKPLISLVLLLAVAVSAQTLSRRASLSWVEFRQDDRKIVLNVAVDVLRDEVVVSSKKTKITARSGNPVGLSSYLDRDTLVEITSLDSIWTLLRTEHSVPQSGLAETKQMDRLKWHSSNNVLEIRVVTIYTDDGAELSRENWRTTIVRGDTAGLARVMQDSVRAHEIARLVW